MKALIAVMAGCVLACAGFAAPSANDVLRGLFVPMLPRTGGGAQVLALLGGIGGSVSVICYGTVAIGWAGWSTAGSATPRSWCACWYSARCACRRWCGWSGDSRRAGRGRISELSVKSESVRRWHGRLARGLGNPQTWARCPCHVGRPTTRRCTRGQARRYFVRAQASGNLNTRSAFS